MCASRLDLERLDRLVETTGCAFVLHHCGESMPNRPNQPPRHQTRIDLALELPDYGPSIDFYIAIESPFAVWRGDFLWFTPTAAEEHDREHDHGSHG